MNNDGQPQRKTRTIAAAVLALVAAGAAAIYATRQPDGNGAPQTATETTSSLATFVRKSTPEAVANVNFEDATGKPVSLEAWRGRIVLLNLWATWCLPCRKEMPALDRLQVALGSNDFEVVALSIDRAGAAGARKFLDGAGVKNLQLYVDPTAKLANDFKAIGLPTTLLIDRQGREFGRLIGPAEWDSPEAQALIRAALAAK